jgi:hypothetical protein
VSDAAAAAAGVREMNEMIQVLLAREEPSPILLARLDGLAAQQEALRAVDEETLEQEALRAVDEETLHFP